MKRCITSTIVAVLLLSFFAGNLYSATYSGGTGEPNNPYLISTVADWQELIASSADWDKNFLLTADIDLAGVSLAPVGNSGTNFTGVVDGNSHVIRNAVINQPSTNYVGLFGWVDSSAQLRNLGVADVNIAGSYYVGGLVGLNGNGSITTCYSTGSVSATAGYVGGLVGLNGGLITTCYSKGTVSGGLSEVGGLVGINYYDGSVTACYSTDSVSGTYYVGGLVGDNLGYYSSITSCYSTGNVNGTDEVGGLVGQNNGSITTCYSTGTVSGGCVGGLVGLNVGSVTCCYSTSSVSGGSPAGGLVGQNFDSITFCYAAGSVSGQDYVGGLVGYNSGNIVSIVSSFWDIQISGQSNSAGGTGKTTAEMKTLATFRDANWGPYGWVMADGVDYPRLNWEGTGYPAIPAAIVPLKGSGTEADPYQIWTPADFAVLNSNLATLDKHILLMSDIDVASETLSPIGDYISPFTGVFDGNNHTIRNAAINMPNTYYVGVFGYVGSGGQIKNLGVEDANIIGISYVGGIVGENYGNVTACYATGTVNESNGTENAFGGLVGDNGGSVTSCYATDTVTGTGYFVGGLIGENWGSVTSCYASGSVTGGCDAGGLVGYNNDGSVTSCYATGSVSGTGGAVGGLMGVNGGSVTSCYATGSVSGTGLEVGGLVGINDYFGSSITSCYATGSVSGTGGAVGGLVGENDYGRTTGSFWDMETSGQTTSAGGTGETTAEMQTKSTFTDAGWDFTTVWAICEGTNYPRLQWQIPAGDWVCPDGVDFRDYAVLANAWMSSPGSANWNPLCDISEPNDNVIDWKDLAVFAENWLAGK